MKFSQFRKWNWQSIWFNRIHAASEPKMLFCIWIFFSFSLFLFHRRQVPPNCSTFVCECCSAHFFMFRVSVKFAAHGVYIVIKWKKAAFLMKWSIECCCFSLRFSVFCWSRLREFLRTNHSTASTLDSFTTTDTPNKSAFPFTVCNALCCCWSCFFSTSKKNKQIR